MIRSWDVASCSEPGRRDDDGAAATLNPFSVLIISGARDNQVVIRTSEAVLSEEAQGRLVQVKRDGVDGVA